MFFAKPVDVTSMYTSLHQNSCHTTPIPNVITLKLQFNHNYNKIYYGWNNAHGHIYDFATNKIKLTSHRCSKYIKLLLSLQDYFNPDANRCHPCFFYYR